MQDFGVGAVAQDVHQQFAWVGVGDAQFDAAVGEAAQVLFGVPLFVGDPAGGVLGEADQGFADDRAGEDAVAGLQVGFELRVREVVGGVLDDLGFADQVQGETAQGEGVMVPGVQTVVVNLLVAFLL